MTIWECLLSTMEVAKLCHLPYRTLDGWVRTNLLPVTVPARGIGRRRQWAFVDVVRTKALAELRHQGVSLQTIRKALVILTERIGESDPLTQGRLIVAGERLFWTLDDDMLLDVLRDQLAAGPLVILDVGSLIRELQPKVLELCAA